MRIDYRPPYGIIWDYGHIQEIGVFEWRTGNWMVVYIFAKVVRAITGTILKHLATTDPFGQQVRWAHEHLS
jgi:hypothetical protein